MLSTRQKRRTPLRYFVLPAVTALALSYFAFQAVEGDYGLRAGEQLRVEASRLREKMAIVSQERARLELQANLLRNGNIERDMIEERARAVLGMVDMRDAIILR